ncbi:unnamed protein product [Polarella glacialis]|uniref:Uncharacterized protein n=1 Tax=Polarella glacialis TaxID=89957 RepID=A0A813IV91_POLGL|nr:unnamed protein product [Polarella glacialis]
MSEFESCCSEDDQEVFGSGDGQDYLGGGDGLILPPLVVGDKSQTIPEPPVDFVHGIIPAVEGSLLKNMHLHIRDNALTFEPVAHKYSINGVPTMGSVTGLLHDFVNEFNADTAFQMMRRSRNWPRAEYLQDGLPMTDEQIKSKWEHNRVDAANQGTYMHLTFELYLNRWTISNYSVEMNIFLKYLSTLDGLTAYRTEWMIYGEGLNLAGSIDFVATRSDGALVLFDWKRTKELHTKYSNRFQSMTGPLSHLADCAGMHYRLQLNVYRYILEKYYGQKVHSMFVVGCHPAYASSQAFVDEVPILEDETTILIRHQFSKTISDEYLDYLGAGDEDPEFDFERQLAEEMAYNNETPIAVAPVRLSQAKEEQAEPETVAVLNQVFGLDNLELTVKTEEADAVAEDEESGGVGTACRKRRLIKGASTSSSDFSNMFSSYLQSATAALDTCIKTIPTTQATILNITKRLTTLIRADHPQWSDRVVRLGVAALSFYRMRPTDMCAREHCLLLWIAEGGNSMRAHKGSCYIYNDVGSFTPYKGIPPETTCSRMKDFILQLEGLFRRLPQGLQREDSELLKAVDTLLLEDESEITFIHKCTDAALFNLGDDRLKPSRGHFDDDAGSGPPSSWPIWIAQALRKVGMQIQRELLEGRLLTYFIEWCDTPVSKKAGVCYADACILYDVSDSLLVHHVEPSPNNDIYVYIPTPLLDPVLESMVARLLQFFSQTFWCNFEVFQCTQAAQALCKRGENLDRCFIGESPGGVGQSLFTAHLAAVYKHNHSYFDPNVWYMDEELRKQIEEFADSFILTGQEAPNGTRQLREDLFKKTMSADGAPGRKPYGLQTRMLELIGWKRLELNKMLRFGSVTETNFNSILRRCFVWKPKARFWDRDYLKDNYPDSHLDGILPKCAELRTFLVSPAAIAASLRIQYGFEQKHSKELCRQMIENYVVLGGDEGMTEERMRFACGLKPRDKRQQTVSGPPDAFASGSQADRDEDTTALFKVHDFLDGSYPESFDIASIKSYVDGNPTRESNALVVIDFFDSVIKALKPRKGRPSAAMTQRLEEVNNMVAKLRKSEELCKQLLHMVQDPADGGVSAKRRRLTRKHSEEEPKKEFHAQHTNYKYVGLPTTRGRRYVVGTGAQSLSRRLQRVAFPHTMDLDQVNSVFVILDQLLDKLEISTVIPNDIRKVISDCAHRREQVCRVDLQTDISTGKQLLHSVLHGGLLKTPHESNVFLQKLQKASIYLRWLACSIMPDAYEFYCNQPDKKFPECTVLQHLCTIVEDHIMEALTDFIRHHPVQHLSLHFDGIRLNVDYRLNVDEPQDVEILMRLAETHIAEAAGFLVQFKVKRHQYLSELITEHTVSKTKVDVPHIFLKRGNCIPLALAHITGEYQHIQTGLGDTDNRDNMYAASRFSRTYRQALTLTQCKLVPHTGFAIDADGVYLLRTDGDGSPHCIGVTVKDAKSSVIIWDGEEQFALPWSEFNLIVNSAIDASSFITFRVFFSADACIWPTDIDKADLETLLELQAGGKKASSTLKRPASANLQTVCKKVAKPVLRRPAAGCDGADSESECNSEPSVDLEPLDVTDPADEAIVVVGDKLLALLKSEHPPLQHLGGVVQGCGTAGAFAVIKDNGGVATWGHPDMGGDSSSVAELLMTGVVQIVATDTAFAAIKDNGSLVTWGSQFFGGDSSKVAPLLTEGVVQVCGTNGACAALLANGSVVTWGNDEEGGDSSKVATLLTGVVQICGGEMAFAAIKADGSVVSWGDSRYGGDSSAVASLLTEGLVAIF